VTERDSPGVIAPPPLIFLAGLAVGFGLEAVLPSASVPAGIRWLGCAPILAGVVLQASFVRAFRRADTNIVPVKPTTAIVTGGPYRITRNPGYLGMALVYVGIALLAGALWPLASLVVVLLVVDRAVIAREERYLEGKFGQEYLDYKRRARRWL
jgi:protein-S-isoprenylcysteine O-methyltransferase Ste14